MVKRLMVKRLMVAVVCLLLTVQGAWALTITNGGATIFSDNFESDTVGSLPTIGAGDIGTAWEPYTTNSDLYHTTDVESVDGSHVLGIQREPGVLDGEIYARFPSQSSGTVEANFRVKMLSNHAGGGSATRVAFTQGNTGVSECCEVAYRHVYLMTAGWHSSWTGSNDDVVAAHFTGSAYEPIGDPCVGCADKWIDIKLTQSTEVGHYAKITLGSGSEITYNAIDGMNFGMNSRDGGTAYIDAIPEPTTVALLLMGIGSLLTFARGRNTI